MILDRIENAVAYAALYPGLSAAFDFLRRSDLAALPDGRHAIDGSRVYAEVARRNLRGRGDGRLECHRAAIDVQYVVAGEEEMGWRPVPACTQPVGAYDAAKDLLFFSDAPDAWIALRPGQFVVFFPDDAHLPLVGQGAVHKVVVKVKMF
jgi:biofilm protein TabA